MKKQTAVEWLMEQLSYDNGLGVRMPSHNEMANLNEYFEQAKAMEKEQIEYAWSCFDGESFEEYYNETFGGDK